MQDMAIFTQTKDINIDGTQTILHKYSFDERPLESLDPCRAEIANSSPT